MRAAKLSALQEEAALLAEEAAAGRERGSERASRLRRDLAVAEAQHATAVRAHLSAVDALLRLHASRVTGLRSGFDARAASALAFLAEQRRNADAAHAERCAALRGDVAALQARAAASLAGDEAQLQAERDRLAASTAEELQVIKLSGDAAVAELDAHLAAEARALEEATADTVIAVEENSRAEAASTALVAARQRELARITDTNTSMRAAFESSSKEWEARVTALRADKDAIFAKHSVRHSFFDCRVAAHETDALSAGVVQELKRTMDRSRGADAARLRDAVVASAAKAKALQEVLAKAQRVARMAALNAADDAAQRAALAGAGVLEAPGATLSAAAARERTRLRAEAAGGAGLEPGVSRASTAAPGVRPGTTALPGAQRGAPAAARPATTRPATGR